MMLFDSRGGVTEACDTDTAAQTAQYVFLCQMAGESGGEQRLKLEAETDKSQVRLTSTYLTVSNEEVTRLKNHLYPPLAFFF